MNTENQETIEDIITEARGVLDELLKHGYNVVSVDRMADIIDRVEEAHKREREDGAAVAPDSQFVHLTIPKPHNEIKK